MVRGSRICLSVDERERWELIIIKYNFCATKPTPFSGCLPLWLCGPITSLNIFSVLDLVHRICTAMWSDHTTHSGKHTENGVSSVTQMFRFGLQRHNYDFELF